VKSISKPKKTGCKGATETGRNRWWRLRGGKGKENKKERMKPKNNGGVKKSTRGTTKGKMNHIGHVRGWGNGMVNVRGGGKNQQWGKAERGLKFRKTRTPKFVCVI